MGLFVSVPLQGTYLPYKDNMRAMSVAFNVSVPLQGTYLPYEQYKAEMSKELGFRPLAGDLSSLLTIIF